MMPKGLKEWITQVARWVKNPWLHNAQGEASFFRATRDDTNVTTAFGVGDGGVNHGVWSDKLGKWLIYGDASKVHIPAYEGGVLYSSGSKTVNASSYYSLCTLTLKPNMAYLILANVSTNNGGTFATGAFLQYSGSMSVWRYGQGRTTTGSGQGTHAWAYAQTSSSSPTITLQCYGYFTTSHTESGNLVAIPLPWVLGG